MKKFLLSALSVLAIGSAADAQVQVTPLVEHFTQASCPPCAQLNPTLYGTLNTFGSSNYVKVTYQVSWPGVDPMNAAYPAGPSDRRTYYNISGVPDARLSGSDQGQSGINSIVSASTLASVAAQTTPWEIEVSHQPTTGTNIDLNVTVYNRGTSAAGAGFKLHTALTEKEITYSSAPGTNGETEFFFVVRNMYDIGTGNASTSGYTMPAIAAGDSAVFNLTVVAPNYADISQSGFALWIQDDSDKSVKQSAYSEPFVPPTALDVATGAVTYGTADPCANAAWTPSFEVTNATSNTITSVEAQYTINGGTPVTTTLSGVSLAQGQSATVTFPATTLNGGANAVEYLINTLNGSSPDYIGSNNADMTGTILVLGTFPANTTPMEGFESYANGTAAPSDAIPVNPDDKPAFIGDAASIGLTGNLGGNAASSKSFIFDFWPNPFQSGTAAIQYNKIDMSDVNKTHTITFDYAYAQYTAQDADRVDINISTDCGATWTNVWSKTGANLATAPIFTNQNQRFMPTAAQWDAVSIDLTATLSGLTAAQRSEVVVEVRGTSGWGNPAYIDNFNVMASTGTNINTIATASAVKVMPNPVRDNMTLEFTTVDATDASINIVNALGQQVQQVANDTYNGTTTIQINTSELAAGMYFLNIATKDGVTSERFVVEK